MLDATPCRWEGEIAALLWSQSVGSPLQILASITPAQTSVQHSCQDNLSAARPAHSLALPHNLSQIDRVLHTPFDKTTTVRTLLLNTASQRKIEDFNKKTWGWNGCSNVWVGTVIYISSGSPPMPNPVANAVCGPQVPGTEAPDDTTDIAGLNPCPLNACCNI